MARQSHIKFTIPEPCNVPWDGMRPVEENQRHCSSCEKVITDFTKMNDDELMLYFKHSNGKVCGRFSKPQLNRPILMLPDKTQKAKWWRAIALIPLTLFGRNGKAQTDSSQSVQTIPDTTAFVQQQDSLQIKEVVSNDSLVADSLSDSTAITVVVVHDSLHKFVWKKNFIRVDTITVYPLDPKNLIALGTCVEIISGMIQPIPQEPPRSLESFWDLFPYLVKNGIVKQRDRYRDLVNEPPQKPKPQQPALPASNEITGILPEELRKRKIS